MKKWVSIMLLLSFLLLAGCGEQLPEYILEAPTTESIIEEPTVETTRPKQWREYATYPVERPTDKTIGNKLYDTTARAVSYHDPELGRRVYVCSQPNCTHSDSKCYAFLGGRYCQYVVVGDLVYALIDNFDEDGSIRFTERNLITGKTRILWDLNPEESIRIEYFTFSIYGEEVFLTYRQYEELSYFEGNYSGVLEKNPIQYSYSIDLNTGELTPLLEAKIPAVKNFSFIGSAIIPQVCTEEHLLIQEITYTEELPLSEEDYYKQNPTGEYELYVSEFLRGFSKSCYYSLNRKTGEKTILSGEGDIAARYSIRDRQMAFVDGDTLCIYNGYTGEVTAYFEQERIANMYYLDGRIIYNIYPEDSENGIYTYFWYDLTTGEIHQFQEGISMMVFSVHYETADYFHGIYNGRSNCFISKQDFYNENYDAAF